MTTVMHPLPLTSQDLGGDNQFKKDILLVCQADHHNVFTAVDELASREAEWEPMLGALLTEANRHTRLRQEAQELCKRFPIGSDRPLLFGVLVGVKDIIHVDGMKTRAGSKLPPELLGGEEAEVVAKLREAGALILGKLQCTEFAFFTPAATQNPTAVGHTPGGSSSGSAAAVAAGLCRLALGTQTTGSISRPAAYCGVVGYKPSYSRIPLSGSVPACKPTDHMGFLASDVEILEAACASCISDWKHAAERGKVDGVIGVLQDGDSDGERRERPNAEGTVVGKMAQCAPTFRKRSLCVPLGPLMELSEADVLASFEDTLQQLSQFGWVVVRLKAFDDLDMIRESHRRLMRFEFLEIHKAWITEFGHLYNPELLSFIQSGLEVAEVEAIRVREVFKELQRQICDFMDEHDVDAWITPGATSAPPAGLGSTGNPFMPVIWSVAGLPSVTLPSAFLPMPESMESSNSSAAGAVPMAITLAGRWGEDEEILLLAKEIEKALDVQPPRRMSSWLRKIATS